LGKFWLKAFADNTVFHLLISLLYCAVQQNLVAQSGDPEGTGKGGESVFRFEHNFSLAYLFNYLLTYLLLMHLSHLVSPKLLCFVVVINRNSSVINC